MPHLEIVHHVGSILIRTCDGDKDAGRNAIDILHDAVPIQDTAILLELKEFVEIGAAMLRRARGTVSTDHVGDKACGVRHRRHLDHGLRAVLERGEHARVHLAADCFLVHGIGIAVIVDLVVLALANDLDIQPHRTRKGVEPMTAPGSSPAEPV